MGKRIHYVPVTSSTMDEARRLAEQDATEGTAVITGKQESGRGRMGRAWLSPEGALATSIILRPPLDALHLLPAISSVAVYRTIGETGIRGSIKWPNDVLISGKKVCGILIENGFSAGNLVFSIIGIGINVNFDTTRFPEIAGIATSLSTESGRQVSIDEVALNLYSEMEKLYDLKSKPDLILDEWRKHMGTLGQRVTVTTGGHILEGSAESINATGNLVLRMDNGSLREVIAGDVANVRDKTK
ncbi:MAG: biotin--[acetyl-CoA-carboxylase] ligase [Dehalococcoidia bacterium]|nr:biotin--[acetyl-CoA-carboxylase] ligase [Dehalococcoidia bacterium]